MYDPCHRTVQQYDRLMLRSKGQSWKCYARFLCCSPVAEPPWPRNRRTKLDMSDYVVQDSAKFCPNRIRIFCLPQICENAIFNATKCYLGSDNPLENGTDFDTEKCEGENSSTRMSSTELIHNKLHKTNDVVSRKDAPFGGPENK